MNLFEELEEAESKTQTQEQISPCFVSLYSVCTSLKNEKPSVTWSSIAHILTRRLEKYQLLMRNGNGLVHVGKGIITFEGRSEHYEEVGKNAQPRLSLLLSSLHDESIQQSILKMFGYSKPDIEAALGLTLPIIKPLSVDHSAEIFKLKETNARLEKENARLSQTKKAYLTEKNAVVREDILKAIISLIYAPNLYIENSHTVEVVKKNLPTARALVKLLDQKSTIFWPDMAEPPLAVETIERLIAKQIKLLK
ncbi:hypothetical protein [Chimaeribacter coloradensis]|uniref:hypothetical protein n=1 Tax=Chimaeribacter coloradensis TaxID=2060068 RepID=UPI0011AF0AF3|nr:hypothetical protein [Chimaeribacter coloradensis]